MKVPIEWLSDFVDLGEIPLIELAERISLHAFEVEGIEYPGANLKGPLVVGEILAIEKHPNADKLQITQTRVAPEQIVQIVCGAINIAVGQKVPVALPGSLVINRKTGEPLSIGEGVIREIASAGMLCSSSELGLEGDEGIKILDPQAPIGADLLDYLGIKPQPVLEIASRSNRGDALSIQGMAREVSAILNQHLKLDFYDRGFGERLAQTTTRLPAVPAEILDMETCAGIGFLRIDAVQIAPSPSWLTERLSQAGIKSINNIVDLTNYVMLELGQPLHGYDASKINQGFQVRIARQGDAFLALDQNQYKLSSECLVIAQGDETLALAGVMGGAASAINENTTSVIYEAACFSPKNVRRSSRITGISTESSRRFERGTDLALIPIALQRIADLTLELAGGQISAFSHTGNKTIPRVQIPLTLQEVARLLGYMPEKAELIKVLERIGIKLILDDRENLVFEIPSYRADLSRPVDLVEEVARLIGFDQITSTALPGFMKIWEIDPIQTILSRRLIQSGYHEITLSSLVPESDSNDAIKMLNPLSREHAELRQSFIPGLLQAARYNFYHQADQVRLFELGRVYSSDPKVKADLKNTATRETEMLGIILSTDNPINDWSGGAKRGDFFELKGVVSNLSSGLSFQKIMSPSLDWHPEICASILNSQSETVGMIGKLHPLCAKEYDLPQETFVAHLKIEKLLANQVFKLKPSAEKQTLWRDFTIDLENYPVEIQCADLEKLIWEIDPAYLRELQVVSLYQKASANGQAALTFRLGFQSDEINLTSDQINQSIDLVKQKIASKYSFASFRA
ncbi:MAG: phenylalanine--tRNA ligase subunit beta [Candidatus Caenarcaniphilales bacterium]|nr:phenylalanine--tRNA ligase subunit beta [Candidatus Caenarcaniphilales bacterium]